MVVKGLPAEWGMCSCTVMLDSFTWTLSYCKNTVAVGSEPGGIIILNAITGSQTAVLSGHRQEVDCLTFSPDGTSLVSGSCDKTIKLWDVQTGGVVRTFSGHTQRVLSISISADCTTIVSGSQDKTICLWNIHTEECEHVIRQSDYVDHVNFSPTDPNHFISICDDKLWQWDTNGHQIKPPCNSSHTAFSPDGNLFVSHYRTTVTVQNSHSGAIMAEFQATNSIIQYCCFSPSSRLVAIADDTAMHIWDITSSDPHLVETLIGHTDIITSLAFSSPTTLISASQDRSVRFWQITAPSMDPIVTSPKSGSLTPAPIKSITLQAKDGITITSDSDGIVKTWDISTGLCKASFQTPAKCFHRGDVQLINGRLIFVWILQWKGIYGWDVERKKHILEVVHPNYLEDLKISWDGSEVFFLSGESVYALSVQTGELVGRVEVATGYLESTEFLTVYGLKVWVHLSQSGYQGWDFGTLGSSSVMLPGIPFPNGSMLWDPRQTRIRNAATGEVVFQLPGRFARPADVQCDGSYIVAGYLSGDVLIVDLRHILL